MFLEMGYFEILHMALKNSFLKNVNAFIAGDYTFNL
jgi:hypothetical protein